ncbi:MAG: hypothetical protein WA981_02585 [Glaciecola sp.]
MTIKRYTITFFGTMLIALVSIASFNYWIDPYHVLHNNCIEHLNCKKTQANTKIFFSKARQWRNQQVDAVILGNSRNEFGLDPKTQNKLPEHTYNLAIRGASLRQEALYLVNVLKSKQPQAIIVGFDYFSFRQHPTFVSQWPTVKQPYLPFSLKGKPVKGYALDHIKQNVISLLSLQATMDSIQTIINQNNLNTYLRNDGFAVARDFMSIAKYEGVEKAFENDMSTLHQRFENTDYVLTDKNGNSQEAQALAFIVKQAQERNIPIYLFIAPTHVGYAQVLKQHGYLKQSYEWKRLVVQTLDSIGYFANNQLLDFSGLNQYTTEAIPKGVNQSMQWWYEAGHYTPLLGKMMLEQLLSADSTFALHPQNVEQRIQKDLQETQVFLQQNVLLKTKPH